MSSIVSDNVTAVLPDGAEDKLEVGTGSDGNDLVAVKSAVTDGSFNVSDSTGFAGKGVVASTVEVSGTAGETTVVPIQTTVFKQNIISNDGVSDLQVNVNTGKFKKSIVESVGNSDDGVAFDSEVRVVKATMDLGDGDDTVTFGKGSKVIGKNVIKFGEGTGKDSVEIADLDDVKGTIVVRNFGRGDSITVNGKTYNFKQAIKFANKNDGLTIRKD